MFANLTEQQNMIRESAQKFAEQILQPCIKDAEKAGVFPKDIYEKAGEMNLLGVLIPENYGGLELGVLDLFIVLESLATISPSFAASLVPCTVVVQSLLTFGTEEQKQKYLPDIAKGKTLCTFAVTEASGGSNWFLTNQSIACLNKDGYVINGSKSFISNADAADLHFVLARTNPEKGPAGFSVLIVENGMDGFKVGTLEDKMGLQGYSVGELIFNNCQISKENILGRDGDGLSVFQAAGNYQCITLGAVALGIADKALQEAIKFTKERPFWGGKTISQLENVQVCIAEMYADNMANSLLIYEAALEMEKPPMTMLPVAACMKMMQGAVQISDKAIKLHGACGCSNEYAVSRCFTDAKTLSLLLNYDQMMSIMGKAILEVPDN